MRILILCSGKAGLDIKTSPVVFGGIERFISLVYRHLPNVEVVSIPKWTSKAEATAAMLSAILAFNPDLVIANDARPYGTIGVASMGIPVMWVCHDPAGTMASLAAVELMRKFLEFRNTSLYFVSKHQESGWQKLAKRRIGKQLEVAGIIRPSCVEKQLVPSSEFKYNYITVGRCQKASKDPFLLHRLAFGRQLITAVFSNLPFEEEHYPYRDEGMQWTQPEAGRYTFWNSKHEDILNELCHSDIYFSTWRDETFGITALEALSAGCLLELNSGKHGHASQELVPDPSFVKLVTQKNALTTPAPSYDQKCEVAERTFDMHGVIPWRNRMMDAIGDSVARNRPVYGVI